MKRVVRGERGSRTSNRPTVANGQITMKIERISFLPALTGPRLPRLCKERADVCIYQTMLIGLLNFSVIFRFVNVLLFAMRFGCCTNHVRSPQQCITAMLWPGLPCLVRHCDGIGNGKDNVNGSLSERRWCPLESSPIRWIFAIRHQSSFNLTRKRVCFLLIAI